MHIARRARRATARRSDRLFEFRDHLSGFVAIPLRDYPSHARQISPRWQTVAMPVSRFRSLATPIDLLL